MKENEHITRWMKKHLWHYRNQHPPINHTPFINENMKDLLKNGITQKAHKKAFDDTSRNNISINLHRSLQHPLQNTNPLLMRHKT
jgi:hypothetical protein